MYWMTDPPIGGFAEDDAGRFLEALKVFSTKAAASEWMRHNRGIARRTREVTGEDLADIIEGSGLPYVVVNPLPYPPFGGHPEDVRPVEDFLQGLR
jgi:hypothetical protein